MKTYCLAQTATVSACLALLPLASPAQDGPDPALMAEAMEKYMTPGPEHKLFKSMVGTWKAKNSYWMQPGAPPMKSTAEVKFRLAMEGRYLLETYKSEDMMSGPFQGQGTLAYDRVKKEYVQTWIDSMGTGIMISRGTCFGGWQDADPEGHHQGLLLDEGCAIPLRFAPRQGRHLQG